jgi:hypothetical protein
MAEESLKIVLTADNKQAIAAMKETILSLDGVDKAAGNSGNKVKKLGTDFTGMSRVIQDLPFGFMAIQNNLTQLIPAAGGAGLAFSALMAGIQFAQVGLTYWTRGSKDASDAMSAQTKSLIDFNVKIYDVKDAFNSAKAGVLSKKEALDKYNDTLGSSIGYAKSIQEAEDLMVKNTATVVKAMQLRTQANVFQAKAAELNARLVSGEMFDFDKSWIEFAMNATKSFFKNMNLAETVVTDVNKSLTQQNFLLDSANKLNEQAIQLEKTLVGSRTKPEATGKTEKKALSEMIKAREAYFAEINRMADESLVKRDQRRLKEMKGEFDTIKPMAIDPKTGKETSPEIQNKAWSKELEKLKLTTQGNSALNQVMLQRNQIEEQRIANLELANNLTNTAMNSLTGLTNAMMNGQNIGQALGDMFKRLALDIALAAAKAAIFQAILSAVSGGTSKGAGGGGFFKMFGKMLGFSEGGTVSGPKSGYPVMLHGTEHIVRPDQMRSIIASASQMGGGNSRVVVEGRISGNDIFISQKRTSSFRALTT